MEVKIVVLPFFRNGHKLLKRNLGIVLWIIHCSSQSTVHVCSQSQRKALKVIFPKVQLIMKEWHNLAVMFILFF